MPNAIEPQRAIVKPRTVSAISRDAVPLEDVVLDWIAANHHGVIEIKGGFGSGRTTALAHLAAVLPADLPIRYFDDIYPFSVEGHPSDGYIITANAPAYPWPFEGGEHAVMPLAGWREDDWIEYLLARSPEQCGSVIDRLQRDRSRDILDSNPELCSIVLDRMARDANAKSTLQILREDLVARLEHPEKLHLTAQRFEAATLFAQAVTFEYADHLVEQNFEGLQKAGCPPNVFHLLRHQTVCRVVTTAQIVNLLELGRERWMFEREWPPGLLDAVASQLDDSHLPALNDLLEHQAAVNSANVAGLLVAMRPDWRPAIRLTNLKNAELCDARWPGVNLKNAELSSARFCRADLSHAQLDGANAAMTDFCGANLESASLCGMTAIAAVCNGTRFNNAIANRVEFCGAEVDAADFSSADLVRARFADASLVGARFDSANLTRATFCAAEVRDASFRDANLHGAMMSGLDLQKCTLDGADFTQAILKDCNLEFVGIVQAQFERANLQGAYLTGSRMPGANFQRANLVNAGLADVDWERADLRKADLSHCTFHMGSSRSGLVGSTLASEGTRTGFYTDEYFDQSFQSPETIRKANLRGTNLLGALCGNTDFYLVDLRGAHYSDEQREHFKRCRAILDD